MLNVVKEPCTAMFTGPTGCGKTTTVLDLLKNEYRHYFENIVVFAPTLRWNKAYLNCPFLWHDDDVFLIDPGDELLEWLKKFSIFFAGEETLFVLDDIISDKCLDKRRTKLLNLAVSGRHKSHSLWLLTQSYTAIPKNLRRQKKMLFMWYPHERSDLKIVDEETNLIEDWKPIQEQLKQSKHGCLYVRMEHPRSWKVVS
jgi:hypothetical protein